MGHPLIDEFVRAHALQPWFFRQCQRVFRDEIQPQLDEREALIAELVALKAEVAALKAAKPKRGRPKKQTSEAA